MIHKNGNKKYSKHVLTLIAVFLFFSLFGYWKFEEALTNPEMCLTGGGDGIGGLGNLFTLRQEADENGLGVLFGDTFSSEKIGFGLAVPLPMSIYWKWNFFILGHLFSPQNVYDFNGLLSFVLIGVFTFILLREMRVSIFFSIVGALLLTHMDHFFARLDGHLFGVGSYYVPVLLAWGAIRAGKKPTLLRLAILALLNVGNFLVFEYYGYYGLFFSCGLFLCYFVKNIKKNHFEPARLAIRLSVAGLVFVILMCLCYPTLVLPKIASPFINERTSAVNVHNAVHQWWDFLYYSVRKPLSLFSSSLPGLANLSRYSPFKSDLGEFTFRIGFVLPIFIFASLISVACAYALRKSQERREFILECAAWILPALLISFFSVNPEHFISLVPITYKIAPMFRVAARAFLYVDITVIVLFAYTADRIARFAMDNLKSPGSIRRRGLYACLLLVIGFTTILGIMDVAGSRIWRKVTARRLPDTTVYESLKDKPEGLVLELPMYSPVADAPESNYFYLYARTKHGFPLVNTSYPLPSNMEFRDALHNLANYLNCLSPQVVNELKSTGVRYVIVDKRKINDSVLRKSPDVSLIADTESKSVFQIKVDELFNTKDFLEHFIYSQPTFMFKGDFHKPERKDKSYWIWSGRRGEMILKNHSRYAKKVKFSAVFYSPVGSTLQIESALFKDIIKVKSPYTGYERVFSLKAKNSLQIIISSDAPPYKPSDPNLIFCMFEYKLKTLD